MKLLFDHNLSPRLVQSLADIYPESLHVSSVGLDKEADLFVWSYAQANGFDIVSKDSDFNDLAFLHGFPPKIIWLQLGNCSTKDVENSLRSNADRIREFLADSTVGILELT